MKATLASPALVAAISILFSTSAMCADPAPTSQAAAPGAPAPATLIETFSSKSGITVIKGFSNIGSISSGQGVVSVEVRELKDASNPKQRFLGLAIEVRQPGRVDRESTSYVDYDEIDSLIRGLDYIGAATKSITTLDNFEAQYRTKADLSVTSFSATTGELRLSVESGRINRTSAFYPLSDAPKLKELIAKAKAKLDEMRAAAR